MKQKSDILNQFFNFKNFCVNNKFLFDPFLTETSMDQIDYYKSGSKIKIKKENRGKFTKYCNGKVTSECIKKGKNSPDPKIRRRATFAANVRSWKHLNGGSIRSIDFNNLFKKLK